MKGWALPKQVGRSFINLIYPPLCLHCKACLPNDAHQLCHTCLTLLELIDPAECCPCCFSPDYSPELSLCHDCIKFTPILNGRAAAFDYLGPAAALVRQLKYHNQAHLAEGCSAYMAAQFLQLNWPMPDVLIPVPISFTHWIERGFNQSELLAQGLSNLLKIPVHNALQRKSGDFSQAALSRTQRARLDGSLIQLKASKNLQDACIMLIDDVITTGSTLHRCAEALSVCGPARIYAMAICRTIQ